MLLKNIEIRNVRKIKQAEIEFHGAGVQVIQGLNKSGKTTIAQSIALTLGGSKDFVPGMISAGEEQAEIIAYTDDELKIRTLIGEKVTQDVSQLDELTGRYAKVSGGVRAFLDSIRSGLEMPFAIKDWTDESIIELLKERTGTSEKIALIDEELKRLEEARTQTGRDKKRLGTPTPVPKVEHAKPIDELQAEKEKAQNFLSTLKNAFSNINQEMHTLNIESESDIDAAIQRLELAKENLHKWLSKNHKQYSKEDIAEIDAAILEWNKNETAANAYDAYIAACDEIKKLEDEYNGLTKKIEAKRQERKDTLASMDLGVSGLEINEDNQLVHNGAIRGITKTNTIGNWSTAQSIQVFFSLGVRFSGEMKVMVVDNAESLDEAHTAIISEWAEKSGFLVIMLKVGDVPEELEEGIIYLKNGEVVANEYRI
ncbi:AAA family ATPase [Treponema phagedenis]|uniref:AAA family ATPase n=1 Tax=Treponema phagedenis TaxID=162 RepID=UPI0011E7728C|nr:AAA family ATPase [Treponema phagedenis]QEJ95781.1 AAA family ATPase [Treponema phagedenis]QKS92979.1 AAA family ATPase [Treponema phagedenis]